MLASLQGTGASVVLTTHHLEEAEQRCEHIVIIDKGKIVASGTLAELVRTTLGKTRVADITLELPWPERASIPAGTQIASADRRALRAEVHDPPRPPPLVFA